MNIIFTELQKFKEELIKREEQISEYDSKFTLLNDDLKSVKQSLFTMQSSEKVLANSSLTTEETNRLYQVLDEIQNNSHAKITAVEQNVNKQFETNNEEILKKVEKDIIQKQQNNFNNFVNTLESKIQTISEEIININQQILSTNNRNNKEGLNI